MFALILRATRYTQSLHFGSIWDIELNSTIILLRMKSKAQIKFHSLGHSITDHIYYTELGPTVTSLPISSDVDS